jgi:hypothetical protein
MWKNSLVFPAGFFGLFCVRLVALSKGVLVCTGGLLALSLSRSRYARRLCVCSRGVSVCALGSPFSGV